MKFFNTIPGDGEVAILLYGDVGDGQKVDSGRVVSELMGDQVEPRKEFIQKHAHDVRFLDF